MVSSISAVVSYCPPQSKVRSCGVSQQRRFYGLYVFDVLLYLKGEFHFCIELFCEWIMSSFTLIISA